MFGVFGRSCASVILVALSLGDFLLIQWLWWFGPKWIMCKYDLDTLSPAVAMPMILIGLGILLLNFPVWFCFWPDDGKE